MYIINRRRFLAQRNFPFLRDARDGSRDVCCCYLLSRVPLPPRPPPTKSPNHHNITTRLGEMPATPRRPPLTSRPQGVYTLAPNLMHIDTDKSPSLALRSTNLPRSTHAKSLFPPASALPSSLKNAPLLFQAPSTAPARVPAHKRPRDDNQDELPTRNLKKSKLAAAIGYATPVKEKKVKHYTQEDKEDRLREINNFIDKYTRYFPTFTFYFDTLDSTRNAFAPKIRQLGGVRFDFLPLISSPDGPLVACRRVLFRIHNTCHHQQTSSERRRGEEISRQQREPLRRRTYRYSIELQTKYKYQPFAKSHQA
jgi:hypothetical protein